MKKVAFIGTGNMGGALIQAACRAIGPEDLEDLRRFLDELEGK